MKNCLLYVVTNSNGIASESYLLYGNSLEDIVGQAEALIEEITDVSQQGNDGLHTRIRAIEHFKGFATVIEDVSFQFSVYTSPITMKFLVEDLLFETDCDGDSGGFEVESQVEDDPFSMFAYMGGAQMMTTPREDKQAKLREAIRKLPQVINEPEECRKCVALINENLKKKSAFEIRA